MKSSRFKWYYKWNEINLETQTSQLRATWSCISSSSKKKWTHSLDMVDSKDNLKVLSSSAKRYLHLRWDLAKTQIWKTDLPIRRNGPPSLVTTKKYKITWWAQITKRNFGTSLFQIEQHSTCKGCFTKSSMRWLMHLWVVAPFLNCHIHEISWTQMTMFTTLILFV